MSAACNSIRQARGQLTRLHPTRINAALAARVDAGVAASRRLGGGQRRNLHDLGRKIAFGAKRPFALPYVMASRRAAELICIGTSFG
jgi:hypothetical protein